MSGCPSAVAGVAVSEVHYFGIGLRDYEAALRAAQVGLQAARESDNQMHSISIHEGLAQVYVVMGDHDAALSTIRDNLDGSVRFGQPGFRVFDLQWTLPSLYQRREYTVCALLGGFLTNVTNLVPRFDQLIADALHDTRSALGDDEYQRLAQRGHELALDDITREVRSALDRQVAATRTYPV